MTTPGIPSSDGLREISLNAASGGESGKRHEPEPVTSVTLGTPDDLGAGELLRVIAANAQDEIHLTDRGNGRRFVEIYRDVVRYVEDQDAWLVRHGPHWVRDSSGLLTFALTAGVIRDIRTRALELDDEDAREAMLRYATSVESETARHRMITTAREHPEIVVREDDLDADPELLAVPNGIVDLRSGELRPARPADVRTRVTTVAYDPDARSDLLDVYLKTFVPSEDDQRVLFAILGTALRGGNPTRIFPIFIGGTTSGKSQLIAALARALGENMCTINSSVFRGNLDDKPRPDLVRAMQHRIAYAVEASKVWDLHADQVKRITGGDSVPYRNLYAQSVEKVPRFTPIIVTNEMPRIKGADAALRRRVLVFTFDKSLPPEREDTRVKEEFIRDENCLRALLARVVAGARDPITRDGVRWQDMPERYALAASSSFEDLNHVAEFLGWMYDRGALVADAMCPLSHCVKAGELHEWYGRWIDKHGDKQDKAERLNMNDFGKALRDRGWESGRSAGTRWVGVRLTESAGALWLV